MMRFGQLYMSRIKYILAMLLICSVAVAQPKVQILEPGEQAQFDCFCLDNQAMAELQLEPELQKKICQLKIEEQTKLFEAKIKQQNDLHKVEVDSLNQKLDIALNNSKEPFEYEYILWSGSGVAIGLVLGWLFFD